MFTEKSSVWGLAPSSGGVADTHENIHEYYHVPCLWEETPKSSTLDLQQINASLKQKLVFIFTLFLLVMLRPFRGSGPTGWETLS